jgi:hypothetical protein
MLLDNLEPMMVPYGLFVFVYACVCIHTYMHACMHLQVIMVEYNAKYIYIYIYMYIVYSIYLQVIMVEYNAKFPPPLLVKLNYDDKFSTEQRGHVYQCSLSWLTHMVMRPKGYSLAQVCTCVFDQMSFTCACMCLREFTGSFVYVCIRMRAFVSWLVELADAHDHATQTAKSCAYVGTYVRMCVSVCVCVCVCSQPMYYTRL